MKSFMEKLLNGIMMGFTRVAGGCRDYAERTHRDERGVEIVIVIILLAILVAIAALFREKITGFVNNLFDDILSF